MAANNPWSAESSTKKPRISSSIAKPHIWSPQKSASSAGSRRTCWSRGSSILSSSSGSIYSRDQTGDHFLDWYIPGYIAGPGSGKRQNSHGAPQQSGRSITPFSPVNSSTPKDEVTVPSPLHNDSKQEWMTRYTDERIRSLPIPLQQKPRILEFPVTQYANNLRDIFGRNSQIGSHVPYSRYGVPMVPLALVPQYQLPWTNYNVWNTAVYSEDPPPQSIFKQVGIAQRRDFTVAPDWRRVRLNHR